MHVELEPQTRDSLQKENVAVFATGAVRSRDADHVRFDLITPIGLRRLAETCAEGARKYGEHNWTKGIPASQMLNHAIRHIYLYLEGDTSEDHLAHAAWNFFMSEATVWRLLIGAAYGENLSPVSRPTKACAISRK